MREQQLQDILRHMPAGVAILQGAELRYGFVNEAMQAVLGVSVAEGQLVTQQPGTLPADLLEVMQEVYRRGQPYVAKRIGCLHRPQTTNRPGLVISILRWNPCAKAAVT